MMRSFLALILLLAGGCSSRPDLDTRIPASVRPVVVDLNVDISRSKVQIFPAVADENGIWYYFHLQLKNAEGKFIDSNDIELKTNKGEKIDFQLKRALTGRYYLTLKKSAGLSSAFLNLFIQGKPIKGEFKLNFEYPSRLKSKIILVDQNHHRHIYRLHLKNEKGELISVIERPEIILEGLGVVEEVEQVSEGVWEFSVVYPEENTIMYFSVRAMGVLLPKLFRYQHVEK